MSWWGYALLSASCWGMQYVFLEILFRRLPFAAAYSFLSLANGILVALVLFLIYPKQDWTQLWQEKRILGMMMLYLIFGSGAYLFNAYAIRDKDANLRFAFGDYLPNFHHPLHGRFVTEVSPQFCRIHRGCADPGWWRNCCVEPGTVISGEAHAGDDSVCKLAKLITPQTNPLAPWATDNHQF
jgi:hypothetical protein